MNKVCAAFNDFTALCVCMSNPPFLPVHPGVPQGLLAALTVPLAVVHLHVPLLPLHHRPLHVQGLETRKTNKSKFGLSHFLVVIILTQKIARKSLVTNVNFLYHFSYILLLHNEIFIILFHGYNLFYTSKM